MFTLLVTEKRHGGLKGLWKGIFHNRPLLEEHHTLDVPWRLIRAPVGKNGPNWAKIERLAGRHCARLVSSGGHQPPPNSRVKTVRLMAFQRIMAARAICRLLGKGPYPGTIGVIDPRARCLSAVEILLEKAGSVKVCTQLPHRYEWFAAGMLRQKGAAVVLCSAPDALADCACVLLGARCENRPEWMGEDTLAFSATEQAWEAENLVCGFEPDCPQKLREQIPDGVPYADLCAALYQFAACRQLAKLEPQTCRIKGRLTQIKDLKPIYEPKSQSRGQ